MKKLLIVFLLALTSKLVNAQSWSTVGSGVDDDIFCQTVFNGELYAGGAFTTAGGLLCNKMAKWNGSNWDTIPGVPGGDNVSALESFNGNLYMGRGNPPFIHMWNNSNWSLLGSGLNEVPVDMIEFNGELYVGGLFTQAGGNPAFHVAKWNGTTWSNLGIGLNDDVLCFAVYNNELYAGGRFAGSIRKWNGSSWVTVGGTGAWIGEIYSMAVYNGELFVGGDITMANAIPASFIASYDGTTWSAPTGNFMGVGIAALAVYNGELYAGGVFTNANGLSANNIAKWDGSNWSVLGFAQDGVTPYADALTVYNGDLYVSGIISSAGGIPANNIAKWSMPTGINEQVIFNEPTLSPNPTTGNFTITFPSTINQGTITVTNTMGSKVFSQNIIKSNNANVQLKNFAKGIYFVKVFDGEKQNSKKIILD